jgi:RNase P/RNase MRP subunit POP5
MKKTVQPRLKPSGREKKRYILFRYTPEMKVSFSKMKRFLQGLQIPGLRLIEFHTGSALGIVRCRRATTEKTRDALNEIGLKTVKTSGTLQKLRKLL